ncbi:G-protein coupled receptor moody [Frankliniella fusca]|uniref:G-protein coupled receptor moody n=1 Tax=Frankliniella fusca TaxID=407009 RepID=A0AAE1H583_9NEOP|nr:G-protein coupled receptor moody [Frankliniella fusca]
MVYRRVKRLRISDPGGDVVAVDLAGSDVMDVLPLERVELFRGYPALLLQAAAACCLLFVVVGVPGNLITIIALNRCKKEMGSGRKEKKRFMIVGLGSNFSSIEVRARLAADELLLSPEADKLNVL